MKILNLFYIFLFVMLECFDSSDLLVVFLVLLILILFGEKIFSLNFM